MGGGSVNRTRLIVLIVPIVLGVLLVAAAAAWLGVSATEWINGLD